MSKKRKNNNIDILLMSDNGLETVGGEQESTKIIINGIKDQYRLGVIQPGEVDNKTENVSYYDMTKHTRIKHLIKNPFAFLKYIWKVRKIIKRENPRIIHTQAQVSFFIVALLKKLRLIPNNFTLIHTERGLYTKYSNFIRKIFFFFMKELDVLVTTTNFNMKYWKQAINEKGIHLDYKIIENTAGELFEAYNPKYEREEDGKLVVGFAGRYTDWKNWPLAVEISKKLNEELGRQLEVRMAIGCLDDKSKSETMSMFKDLRKVFGSRFKGKINISIDEMDLFYYELDVFILTSNKNTESFGRTLVEAMSRKTIVLSTDSGGSVEVVNNSHNICERAEDFKDVILSFFSDESLMDSEKHKNFNYVKDKYSLANNIDKHSLMYKTFIQ